MDLRISAAKQTRIATKKVMEVSRIRMVWSNCGVFRWYTCTCSAWSAVLVDLSSEIAMRFKASGILTQYGQVIRKPLVCIILFRLEACVILGTGYR
jgi:hypothetical protein